MPYLQKNLKNKAFMSSIYDLILVPIYLILIFGFARLIKSNNIEKYPEYRYFVKNT